MSTEQKQRDALRRIQDGANTQGPFTGMDWRQVQEICAEALPQPKAPDAAKPETAREPSKTQMKQLLDGLGRCHTLACRYEFLRVWIRDWAAILPATDSKDCTRSHPHEEMGPMCALRTEIARLQNKIATMVADSKAGGEPIGFMNKDDLEWITDESRGVHAFMSTWLYKSAGGDCSVPIFTRPQQAKPLTDEQRKRLFDAQKFDPFGVGEHWFLQGIIAAERAHGIGNQA